MDGCWWVDRSKRVSMEGSGPKVGLIRLGCEEVMLAPTQLPGYR